MATATHSPSLPSDAQLLGLEILWADGGHEVIDLEAGPRIAIDRGPFGERADLGNLIADVLCGGPPRADLRRASLRFGSASAGKLELRRDFERGHSLLIDDEGLQTRLEGEANLALPGLDRSTLRRSTLIRGHDHAAVGGGREALAASLRRIFGIADSATSAGESERQREIEDLSSRLREVESALAALDEASPASERPADPPALQNLLESLEEAREIDRRLISRRLELARALDDLSNGEKKPGELAPAVKREIRECQRLLEASEKELKALCERARPGKGMTSMAVAVLIGLLSASGLMLAGKFVLDDSTLAELGLRAAGGVLALGFIAWFIRSASVVRVGTAAKKAGARATKLRERARREIAAAGGPARLERVDAATLREFLAGAGRRSAQEEIVETLAPFIDEAEEIQWLRQLEMGLAQDLGDVAVGNSSGSAPKLPLVRATDQVLDLTRNWAAALENHTGAVAEHVENRVRREIEEEMLQKAKRRLTSRLSELRVTRPSRSPALEQGESLARRLNTLVAPALLEILGDNAPLNFDARLAPRGGGEPDAEVNGLTLLLARLLVLNGESDLSRSLGAILVDPGVTLSPEREAAFLAWLAQEPRLGRLLMIASRPEALTGMRRRGGGSWLALVREVRSRDGRHQSPEAIAGPGAKNETGLRAKIEPAVGDQREAATPS
jgi:hypothetical protein